MSHQSGARPGHQCRDFSSSPVEQPRQATSFRGSVQTFACMSPELAEGMAAYAAGQADIRRGLARKFGSMWDRVCTDSFSLDDDVDVGIDSDDELGGEEDGSDEEALHDDEEDEAGPEDEFPNDD